MKLVKEYISFERGVDPKNILGIGQRYLIEKWLEEMNIKYYTINDDMTITVKENIDFYPHLKNNLPDYIQFLSVEGHLDFFRCPITTLRGCPEYVGDYFGCPLTKVTSLKYGPKEVFCNKNNRNLGYAANDAKLISLEGLPKKIDGNLWIYRNPKVFTIEEIRNVCDVTGKIQVSV
jgi:hypothetical protein